MFSLNKCVFSAALISALATVPVYAEDASDETSNVEEKTCDAGKTCVRSRIFISKDSSVTGMDDASKVIAEDGSFIFDNYHFLGIESLGTGDAYYGVLGIKWQGNDSYDPNKDKIVISNSKFENNSTEDGGAVWVESSGLTKRVISIYTSDFIGNRATDGSGGAVDGGPYVDKIIDSNFIGNSSVGLGGGGAVYVGGNFTQSPSVLIDNSKFIGNTTSGKYGGGALTWGFNGKAAEGYENFREEEAYTTFTIQNSTFEDNKASAGVGGAINLTLTSAPAYFINNTFTGNEADYGGALFIWGEGDNSTSITDTSFTGNTSGADGGAIYAQDTDLLIAAVNNDVVFKDNNASDENEDYNAGGDVYFEQYNDSKFSLKAAEGKTLTFNDSIATCYEDTQSQMLINKTDEAESTKWAGTVAFNDRVGDEKYNFDIQLYNGTLKLGALDGASVLDHNSLTIAGASALDTQNGAIDTISLSNFTLSNSLSWALDVDLTSATMDSLLANAVEVGENGSIKVSSINILNDSEETTYVTTSTSVLEALRKYVSLDEALSTVKSEDYAYKVSYNDDGTFTFERTTIEEETQPVDDEQQLEDNGGSKPITGDGTLETADPIVAEKASSMHFANELQNTINTFFFNDYMTFKHTAALSSRGLSSGEDPLVHNMWVRAFGYDDTYHYKNFQNVEVKTGMLTFGVSSDVKELSASTDMVYSLYAGTFDGKSRLADRSVKVNENGGYVGAVATFMRNDWTFGGNLTLAYDRSETKDAYGSEKYDNYWGGMTLNVTHRYMLAKTYSLDGGVLGGATVVKGSSGHTTTGDRIKTDDMTVLSFTPTLKFNKHLDEKNILFVEGRYMMIDSDAGQVLVNDVSMDTLSSGNYAEYGVGYQRFDDPVSVDIAVYRRTGDRDGYSVDAGLKWSF